MLYRKNKTYSLIFPKKIMHSKFTHFKKENTAKRAFVKEK